MALIDWTNTWETAVPDGATQPGSVLDDSDHDIKEQVARRLEQGGHVLTHDPNSVGHGLTPDSTMDGRHVVDAGGAGISPDIYNADGVTKLVAYEEDSVVIKSDATFTAPGVSAGENPGHKHDTTLAIPLPVSTVGRVVGIAYLNLGEGNLEILGGRLSAFTPPDATFSCVVNIYKLIAMDDPNDAGVAIFDAGFEPTLAAGEYVGDLTTGPLTGAVIAEGSGFVIDIEENTGALDVTLYLKVRRG